MIYHYGKESLKREKMDYWELIVRITSHILDKCQVMIRYQGLYANAHRGKKQKSGEDTHDLPIIEEDSQIVP